MLLGYGVKNYTCFKEGVEISFKLSQNCPDNISMGKDVSNILCIKGANGSGKTNILKALFFLFDFCNKSFLKEPIDETGSVSFFNNRMPSEFYINFTVGKKEYTYDLVISKKEIISESLYRKKKRKTKLFQRNYNKLTFTTKEFNSLNIIKLRSNASIISTSHHYEVSKNLDVIYKFFSQAQFNLNHQGLKQFDPDLSDLTELYFNNKELFTFLKKIIISCDSGINDIIIDVYEKEDGGIAYRPIFQHLVEGKIRHLNYFSQSSGTKSLYKQLALYKVSLLAGSLLVLDEFDINFHPHILPFLLELFLNKKSNPNNAQFLFTTHNIEVMDFLGKYRTYLVNKEDNESYTYRLDEVPGDILRNDRSIVSAYNAGKIGGIPSI